MLLNFICTMAILTVLSDVNLDKTVSDNDLEIVETVKTDDLVKSVDEPILLKSVVDPGAYYNNEYVGWQYIMFEFSSTGQYWVLIYPTGGNWYNTTFYATPQRIEVQFQDMNNTSFAVDFDGTVDTYTYGTYPTYYKIVNQNYPNSGRLTRLRYGIVQAESEIPSGGGDSIDYTDLLTSIDEKLTYFENLFYYGDSLDSMGDGFKVLIILMFVLVLNLIVKIISWRW